MDVTLEKLVYRVPKVQRGVIRQSLRQKDRGEVETAGPRPSVVIRRMERGETLWDIAKSCGSTVDDIRCANTLPGEEAAAGTLLLIPARRN